MKTVDYQPALAAAVQRSQDWLSGYEQRPVGPPVDASTLLERAPLLALPNEGLAAEEVIGELVDWIEPGLSALGSGRYLAMVTGGVLPSALAADWLVSAWDQNTTFAQHAPAPVVAEHLAGRWIVDLLGLPEASAVGFPTGAQAANTVCLMAARNAVLETHGVDVERQGVGSGPAITVIGNAEQHVSIDRSVRLLGLGTEALRLVPADSTGAMDPTAFGQGMADIDGPVIVCAQAGNVNGGAFDPLAEIAALVAERRAVTNDIWLHVDGAFGLWVLAGKRYRHLAEGAALADSWTCDAHKWLNTPYDCGIAIVADRQRLARAVGVRAGYLPDQAAVGDPVDTVTEFSRRARGVPVWAALRSLGRDGVAELVDGACDRAAELAAAIGSVAGLVVRAQQINQVVVEALDERNQPDEQRTRALLAGVIADGRCYPSVTMWKGRVGIRLSVSNWRTDGEDVQIVADAFRAVNATL
jgi:glutamate/tyrosine decarboxylase-like PLP-dependent enzyme